MATKDIRSDLLQLNSLYAVIASDTTTNGAIIDTAKYDNGLMFAVVIPAYTDGTYDLVLEEDDDIGFGTATVLPTDTLIGALPSLSTANPQGSTPLHTVGVFGNKRYLRPSITSTSVTTGATVLVLMTLAGETAPVDEGPTL